MRETSASSRALASVMDEVGVQEDEIRTDESVDWID